jgi:hypothetical protein
VKNPFSATKKEFSCIDKESPTKRRNMDLLSMADVERRTGVPRSWTNYQMQKGLIQEPSRLRGRRCFTPEQADEIKRQHAAYVEKKLNRQKTKEKKDAIGR